MSNNETNLTPEEFVLRAIERLRVPPFKGIHAVFSGFNEAFRQYFPRLDPIETTKQLAKQGKIVVRPTKNGVLLYKAEDVIPVSQGNDILKKIIED